MVVPAHDMLAATASGGGLAPWQDPERDRLLADLAAVNEELAATRLDLADVEHRLRAFAAFHDRLLAPLYAELDEVDAQIAELVAERSGSEQDLEDAARARERARKSARAAEQATADRKDRAERVVEDAPKLRPSDRARQLFRALIKLCHPDLATDDAERDRREHFTRLVNQAYAASDTEQLDQLSVQWQAHTDGGEGPARSPTELRSLIETSRTQLSEARQELATLAATSFGRLLLHRDDPMGAVRSAAERVRIEIRTQQAVLRRLKGR